MSKDALNRQRWSVDQRKKARAVAPVPDYSIDEQAKLIELEKLADAMAPLPHMASALESVRARIKMLSRKT